MPGQLENYLLGIFVLKIGIKYVDVSKLLWDTKIGRAKKSCARSEKTQQGQVVAMAIWSRYQLKIYGKNIYKQPWFVRGYFEIFVFS